MATPRKDPADFKPSGGAREGAGRKEGAATRKTRALIDKMATEDAETGDVVPIEMVILAARKHFQAAQAIEAETGILAALDLYAAAGELSAKACPYRHPRLASIEANVNVGRHEDRLDELDPDGVLGA
jgi:hypothetical protein